MSLLVSQHLSACLELHRELQSGADTGTRSAVYCFIGNCEATSEIGYRSYRLLPENHFNQPTNKGWKILLPTPTYLFHKTFNCKNNQQVFYCLTGK